MVKNLTLRTLNYGRCLAPMVRIMKVKRMVLKGRLVFKVCKDTVLRLRKANRQSHEKRIRQNINTRSVT